MADPKTVIKWRNALPFAIATSPQLIVRDDSRCSNCGRNVPVVDVHSTVDTQCVMALCRHCVYTAFEAFGDAESRTR